MEKIKLFYFSPTGTTKKIAWELGKNIAQGFNERKNLINIDFTLPNNRKVAPTFSNQDIVIVGLPVYAGRVPNVLLKYLKDLKGNGAIAVAFVVYGNRNYDDALIELRNILEEGKFKVIGAGAFIGEHSFSRILAKDRPDKEDLLKTKTFAEEIILKLNTSNNTEPLFIKGNKDYDSYYIPQGKDGKAKDIRRVVPKTNNLCIDCKICAEFCPMGSIDYIDVSKITGVCIKCCACLKKCPVDAKYFDDPDFLFHKKDLEENFKERKEPESFL